MFKLSSILSFKRRKSKKRSLTNNSFGSKTSQKKEKERVKRKKEKKLRKYLWIYIGLTAISWSTLILLVLFTKPTNFVLVLSFFFVSFTALFTTSIILFVNTRRALIVSTSLFLFLLLRYFNIGNLLNLLLIAGLAITIELYFTNNF